MTGQRSAIGSFGYARSVVMEKAWFFAAGAAVGFVLGTRYGRQTYEKMRDQSLEAWHNPTVQEKVGGATETVKDKAPKVRRRSAHWRRRLPTTRRRHRHERNDRPHHRSTAGRSPGPRSGGPSSGGHGTDFADGRQTHLQPELTWQTVWPGGDQAAHADRAGRTCALPGCGASSTFTLHSVAKALAILGWNGYRPNLFRTGRMPNSRTQLEPRRDASGSKQHVCPHAELRIPPR